MSAGGMNRLGGDASGTSVGPRMAAEMSASTFQGGLGDFVAGCAGRPRRSGSCGHALSRGAANVFVMRCDRHRAGAWSPATSSEPLEALQRCPDNQGHDERSQKTPAATGRRLVPHRWRHRDRSHLQRWDGAAALCRLRFAEDREGQGHVEGLLRAAMPPLPGPMASASSWRARPGVPAPTGAASSTIREMRSPRPTPRRSG